GEEFGEHERFPLLRVAAVAQQIQRAGEEVIGATLCDVLQPGKANGLGRGLAHLEVSVRQPVSVEAVVRSPVQAEKTSAEQEDDSRHNADLQATGLVVIDQVRAVLPGTVCLGVDPVKGLEALAKEPSLGG